MPYLKSNAKDKGCVVCDKVERAKQKREKGKAMQELLLISLSIADILIEALKKGGEK